MPQLLPRAELPDPHLLDPQVLVVPLIELRALQPAERQELVCDGLVDHVLLQVQQELVPFVVVDLSLRVPQRVAVLVGVGEQVLRGGNSRLFRRLLQRVGPFDHLGLLLREEALELPEILLVDLFGVPVLGQLFYDLGLGLSHVGSLHKRLASPDGVPFGDRGLVVFVVGYPREYLRTVEVGLPPGTLLGRIMLLLDLLRLGDKVVEV